MRIISIVTLAQIVSWGIFILGDCLSEFYSNDTLLLAALLLIPLIMPVIYLVFQKRVHYGSIPKWVNVLTVLGVWVTDSMVIAFMTGSLQRENKWPIPQFDDGWEDLLNGIEYGLFPLFLIAAALIIVPLWDLIVWINEKYRCRNSGSDCA